MGAFWVAVAVAYAILLAVIAGTGGWRTFHLHR
jgi:hypothetical protein